MEGKQLKPNNIREVTSRLKAWGFPRGLLCSKNGQPSLCAKQHDDQFWRSSSGGFLVGRICHVKVLPVHKPCWLDVFDFVKTLKKTWFNTFKGKSEEQLNPMRTEGYLWIWQFGKCDSKHRWLKLDAEGSFCIWQFGNCDSNHRWFKNARGIVCEFDNFASVTQTTGN